MKKQVSDSSWDQQQQRPNRLAVDVAESIKLHHPAPSYLRDDSEQEKNTIAAIWWRQCSFKIIYKL